MPAAAGWSRFLWSAWLVLGSMLLSMSNASAHKASDAYLKLAPTADGRTSLRVDVALRDLDAALDMDSDGNAALTWGEVKAAWPAIDDYVQRNVQLADCRFDRPPPALEKRADGVYAVLQYVGACPLSAGSVIRYTLLADIDPTHRGLASIELPGAAPLLRVLDPQHPAGAASQAAGNPNGAGSAASPDNFQFLREGIHHIVSGYDHVLFLMALMLPSVMRRTPSGWKPVEQVGEAFWPVLGIVTSFTVAHSITLALASLRLISLPTGFIEPAIAVTIVLAALDNLWPIFGGRRVIVTFLFGLIHGFGFASVLAELHLPPLNFAWALLQFNVGLELGQITIVLIAGALLFLARRRRLYAPVVINAGSCIAILIGVLWFIERTADIPLLRM
ncbi:MAG: HupE/UreJ family protein [Ideonella sp.]